MNKLYILGASILGVLLCLFVVYESGVSDGKASMQSKIDEFKGKAELLEQQISNQSKEVEEKIVYKDRVIYKKQEVLIGRIDNGELAKESKQCVIGPAFIGLHNLAVGSN